MVGCWAVNCSNRSEKGVRMHKFPRDPIQRALWAKMTRRINAVPTNHTSLCESHFASNQYETIGADGRKKLLRNAVPTVFNFTPISRNKKSKASKKCLGKPNMLLHVARQGVEATKSDDVSKRLSEAQTIDSMCSTPRTGETLAKEGAKKKIVNTKKPAAPAAIPIMIHPSLLKSLGPGVVLQQLVQGVPEQRSPEQPLPAQPSPEQPTPVEKRVIRVERIPLEAKSRRTQLIKLRPCCSAKVKLGEMQAKLLHERRRAQRSQKRLIDQNTQLSVVFNPDQLEAFTRNSTQGLKWHSDTLGQANELFTACGRKGYEKLLELGYPLPAPRTLERARKDALKEAQADIESTFIKDTEEELNTVTNTELACN